MTLPGAAAAAAAAAAGANVAPAEVNMASSKKKVSPNEWMQRSHKFITAQHSWRQ